MIKQLALALALLISACGSGGGSGSSSNVKYFGYARALGADSIAAVAPFTNFTTVIGCETDCSASFAAAEANDIQLVPELENVFFSGGLLNPILRPDWVARWNALVPFLSAHLSTVLALYIVDEPGKAGIPPTQVAAISDLVKATFPTTPIVIIESYLGVSALVVPTSTDWIGFSQYGIPNVYTNAAYNTTYAALLTKRSRPDQRTILIMDGWWSPSVHGVNGLQPSDMAGVADSYEAFALAHKDIIAIGTFIWSNPFAAPILASVDMPSVVQEHRVIGKRLIGK